METTYMMDLHDGVFIAFISVLSKKNWASNFVFYFVILQDESLNHGQT